MIERASTASLIVVMGVAGCGKSSAGAALAQRLRIQFQDGDDLHPEANIRKMSRGVPLTDEDRKPWLRAVGAQLRQHDAAGLVVACSALRTAYRDALREYAPRVFFVHLDVTKDVLAARMVTRLDHFMPLALLDSQLSLLEPLEPTENGIVVDASQRIEQIVQVAENAIRELNSAPKEYV